MPSINVIYILVEAENGVALQEDNFTLLNDNALKLY